MNWLAIIKFVLPGAFIAVVYFWAHDAGWKERDSLVAAEKQVAVDSAIDLERESCKRDNKLLGGINAELSKGLERANNLHADAIGRLYDASHNGGRGAGLAGTAAGDNGPPGAGRLYYADPAGAIPAIDRAGTATKQAEQLIGCQAYIRGVLSQQNGSPGM